MSGELEQVISLLQGLHAKVEGFDDRLSNVERQMAALSHGAQDISPAQLQSPALALSSAEDDDVILCLDFGTARSKAFATRGSDENLLDVAVGSRSGALDPHSVLSCLFISDAGKIYFGDVAASRSESAVVKGARKRFDSFKGMITNSHAGADLREITCKSDLNPTQVALSEGDVLSLFLAYLTDLAGIELTERHRVSRYVKRRFTTPVFADAHRQWAAETLRRHYCEAILLADHFSGKWSDGIDVEEAKAALKAAAESSDSVSFLIVDPTTEPVAAFGSRFRNYESEHERRQVVSIVDAGAGTTDYASFVVVERPGESVKMFLIPGSIHAVRKAGDYVDQALCEFVMDAWEGQSAHDSVMRDRVSSALSLQRRNLKERLFREKRVQFALADDTKMEIALKSFLDSPKMTTFAAELKEGLDESFRRIDPSWMREGAHGQTTVVLTGGSSKLPMIKALAQRQAEGLGYALYCVGGREVPVWVEEYPELVEEYPQLSVAIGGASRELPALAPSTFKAFSGLGDAGGPWVVPHVYKGN